MTVEEKKWYVIHVLSGHEKKIKTYLESEIESLGLSDKISTILIPSEEVTEMKNGKKKIKNKIFFPGYMLVEAVLDNDVKHLITSAPGVTNFVGAKNEPQPLRGDEIERILGRVDESRHRQTVDVPFREGDPVKVIDGPFTDFTGYVQEVNQEKSKVKVTVSIFGRATPVELDFLQVELEK
ncbi:transcription termination/antitermination factor NusG [candidate division KSB1 bacterium]|nr:transcription termination/antitermination factor NusG [candidate division KSB1 bacterium]RQV93915.1 MAG: transcription termination/antitermination factor NusG [bacterium]